MPYTFQEATRKFRNDDIRGLSEDADGLRFLKLRSLSRKEHMERLAQECGITHPELRGDDLLRFL